MLDCGKSNTILIIVLPDYIDIGDKMNAVQALFPVFFMLFLGYIARKQNWITLDQNEGAKKIVFSILFPLLVYNVLVSSELRHSFLVQILYMILVWIIVLFIGFYVTGFTGKKFAHISPYLLVTCEGGNVALPLYLSLVGSAYAVNIVTFDVAGILINFGLLPVIITKNISGKLEWKQLLKRIFTSSFMIAVILGVVMNVSGLHKMLMTAGLEQTFNLTMNMVTTPITGIILFTLGYELKLEKSMVGSLLRLAAIRIALCSAIIGSFFVVFPDFMVEEAYKVAVILYFLCPTGFPVPLQVQPLVRNEEDENFMSAFISLFLIVALVTYTIITLFIS